MVKPKHNPTADLYTTADVKSVRTLLLSEQKYLDKMTGIPLSASDSVLDHDHDTQYVRGALHRQSNVMLGKIENAWLRYMKYWSPISLPEFLRKAADYLENQQTNPDTRWHHPGWIKKIKTAFNKLGSSGKTSVLNFFGSKVGKNDTERKENFNKLVLTKEHSRVTLLHQINLVGKE